jgi:protein phosphatase
MDAPSAVRRMHPRRHHRGVVAVRIPEPSVVVLIGAAGSGKSTLAARHFPAEAVLSSDALREHVSGDAADQSATKVAFRILHRQLTTRLAAGRLAVVDATNTTTAARRAILDRASAAGVPAIAVALDLPAAISQARAAARPDRRVPADVIDRQHAQVHHAVERGELARDGFQTVIVLRTPDDVGALRVEPG